MGDASSVRLAIAAEATFGSAPSLGYFFQRFNRESLKLNPSVVQSGEIDPSRQPAGSVRTNLSAGGQIEVEDSLIAPAASPATGFDFLIEGAMASAFDTPTSLSSEEIDITNVSSGTFDLIDQHVSADAFANVSVGDAVFLEGFTVNGRIFGRCTVKTGDDDITVEGVRLPTGAAVTGETGETSVSIRHSNARIGTTKLSFAIEKQYTDLSTPEYSLYTGMRVGSWSERLSPAGIFTMTFDLLGKLQATSTVSTPAAAPGAKWNTDRLNAVDHFQAKMEGDFTQIAQDGSSDMRINEITFTLDNGLRTEPELGVLGSQDIGLSTATLSGTLVAYMQTGDLTRKLESDTLSKLGWLLTDGTRGRLYTLPSIRYTDGRVLAEGNDQTVLARMDWSAEPDANGVAFSLDRYSF